MDGNSVLWISLIMWDVLLITFLTSQTLFFSISRKLKLYISERKMIYGITFIVVCNVVQCFHSMLKESRTTTDTFNTDNNQTNIIF